MSLRIHTVATRTYDQLKQRPGAHPRVSDARDPMVLEAITRRLSELTTSYRLGSTTERGITYLFWTEVLQEISNGAFDDLLDRL